jgi:AraC-like DNA-binding protein
MTHTRTAPPRGFRRPEGGERFDLRWHEPSEDLAFFVEGHWIVAWDARGGPPQNIEVPAQRCVNVLFEPDGPSAYGVNTPLVARATDGAGWRVATCFRPAGFQPFSRSHMSDLTGRVVALHEIFQMPQPAPDILGAADDRTAIAMVEDLLRAQHPARDPNVDLVNRMITAMIDDPELTGVDAVAARFATNPRRLHRLFARYVGVPPAAFLREPG